MTAKEKAIELLSFYREYIRMADKYSHLLGDEIIYLAKQCAMKVCEEKIKTIVEVSENQKCYAFDVIQKQIEIKQEIEKL